MQRGANVRRGELRRLNYLAINMGRFFLTLPHTDQALKDGRAAFDRIKSFDEELHGGMVPNQTGNVEIKLSRRIVKVLNLYAESATGLRLNSMARRDRDRWRPSGRPGNRF